MLILALDTTTAHGSVALARDGQLIDEVSGDASVTHGRRLPGDIETILARHGLSTSLVDRYAVALGPGSFTGLRVGIATIQALALVHGRPVIGLSVLDALVHVAAAGIDAPPDGPDTGDRPEVIVPWVDAKRGEVFSAIYEPAATTTASEEERKAGWVVTDGPVAEPPERLLDRWRGVVGSRRALVLGDGVTGTRTLLDARLGPGSRAVDDLPPLAGVMARMAGVQPWSDQAMAPHALRPVYVRRPDAELARARRRPSATPADGPAAARTR